MPANSAAMGGTAVEDGGDVWEEVSEDAGVRMVLSGVVNIVVSERMRMAPEEEEVRGWLHDQIEKVAMAGEERPTNPQLYRPNPFHYVYISPRASSVRT